jgi:hypothetical protein
MILPEIKIVKNYQRVKAAILLEITASARARLLSRRIAHVHAPPHFLMHR